MTTQNHTSRDDGYAVITAVLISIVVLTLSVMAIGLAIHNQDGSSLDRDRVKAVHAAEAGINDAMARILSAGAIADAPCTVSAALSADPPSQYQATITYYSTWPLQPSTVLGCVSGSLPPSAVPVGAVIDSVGAAGRSQRRMQTAARLSPAYGGTLDKAVFSDGELTTKNNVSVSGDVYTNYQWDCTTAILVTGDFYGQLGATMENTCTVTGRLWVRDAIDMSQSATVGGDAISGLSSISLANTAHIGGRAIATTCPSCSSSNVALGFTSVLDGSAPPLEPLPDIWTDPEATAQQEWRDAGYDVIEFSGPSACDDARASILGFRTASKARVVRILEACRLTFANNTNVVVPHNLAIVTNGSMEFVNRGVWTTPDARHRDLFLIVPRNTSCTTPANNGEILKHNNTDFDHLHFLAFSPCKIVFANNNPSSSGQIYGGEVTLENNFSLAYQPMLLPGMTDTATIVGFSSELAYIREVSL